MIDIDEKLISPKDVCRLLPGREGRGLSLSTIWRWMLKGRRGHRLESILVGGRRYTSRNAVYRFIAACNGTSMNQRDDVPVGQAHELKRTQLQRIEQALQSEGF